MELHTACRWSKRGDCSKHSQGSSRVWIIGIKEIVEVWLVAEKGAVTHLVQKEMISLNPFSSGVSRAAVSFHNRLEVHWVLLDTTNAFSQSRGSYVYKCVHVWINLPENQSKLWIHFYVCVNATMNSITQVSAGETRSKVISTQLFPPSKLIFQHMQQLKMMTNIQAHVRTFLASGGFGNPALYTVTVLCYGIILKMAVHSHSLGAVV